MIAHVFITSSLSVFLRDSVLFLRGGKLPAMKITGYDHLPSA